MMVTDARLSHRGVCVSDIDASIRFYGKALGFAPAEDYGRLKDPALDTGTDLSDVDLRAQMMRNPAGVTIELLYFHNPPAFGPRERRPNNQYGLTHLAFYVDDMDAAAARVKASGGHVFEHTRAHFPEGGTTLMYCTDPDGTRVELMQAPDTPPRFSHSGICVTDVARSMPFYELLGFAAAENYELYDHSSWLDVINELEGVQLRAQMIRDPDGNTIELLNIRQPQCFGPRERRALNQLGLTHLAFWVDDIDATAAMLAARGGRVFDHTRSRMNSVEMLHLADPDGVRIELMQALA